MNFHKILKLLTRYFLLSLVLLVLLVSFLTISYRAYLQDKVMQATAIRSPNGIELLEAVDLNGVKQWILIRGCDVSNPVLLHLHGGPGAADISIARHFDGELVKHFVVVHWDQRGAGKSFNPDIPRETMNREQFVSDIKSLSELLKKRLGVPKIYLVGHSWGSEIGMLSAARYPELFHAFVGVSQVVEYDEAERISYDFVTKEAAQTGNQRALQELRAIAPPYKSRDELLMQRKWLEHFGGQSHSDLRFKDMLKIGLSSPDYSLVDGLKFFRGGDFSPSCLWEEGKDTDLFVQAPQVDIPVYFFVGKYDYNTPGALVERYVDALIAPRGKHIVFFENSGHMIPYESPQEYADALINRVLAETHSDNR
ncbi:MAG: alpha/beta hydrolase [Candidatus Abyssobacteria bacterium SURF_5]|uniref:Alpha/beta hydrolase n=1 Tax=Abyssobacteria bacterium (strain SURF_5) TaxID=2093360 RepID=A0A3A4NW41_ABYX5|nr:MAG: alpha/beta hydrolase [Candidatus Abyssubacteria bacterium SURF_5]